MRKHYLMWIFVVSTITVLCQTTELTPSTYSAANASVADNKYYSAFKNPASLATQQGIGAGIQYENKFIINELSKKSIYTFSSTRLLNIGVAATYSGYQLYNEILTGVVLAKNFDNVFQLGVQYNYYSVYSAEDNKRHAAFFPQIGLIVKVAPAFHVGFSTFNPGQQTIQFKYIQKRIPSVFSLGFDWKISDNLNFLFQTDKNISGNYRIAGGFEYQIKDFLIFRTGAYHTKYLTPTLGCGLKFGTFDFYINTELHPILGLTTNAAIQYIISKK